MSGQLYVRSTGAGISHGIELEPWWTLIRIQRRKFTVISVDPD